MEKTIDAEGRRKGEATNGKDHSEECHVKY